jgi:hypothetical protein
MPSSGSMLVQLLLLLALAVGTGHGEMRLPPPEPPAPLVRRRRCCKARTDRRKTQLPPARASRVPAGLAKPGLKPYRQRPLCLFAQDPTLSPLELLDLGAAAVRYLRAFTTQCWLPVRAVAPSIPFRSVALCAGKEAFDGSSRALMRHACRCSASSVGHEECASQLVAGWCHNLPRLAP